MNYWLLKSEPETFSIEDLANSVAQITSWEGVRNYQARNYLCDMRIEDLAFFYHSSCQAPGIYGIVKVVNGAYPDPSALQPSSIYFDEKSTVDKPRWFTIDVQLMKILANPILLTTIKQHLVKSTLPLLRRGNRLSVMPVSHLDWQHILSL